MSRAERAAFLCVVASASGPVRIGVADDPRKRLRELQVGSPVALVLALAQPFASRRDAEAVLEALERQFADRRVQGKWYRLGVVDVRSALANPATLAAPAAAAAARAAAAAEAAKGQARFARRRGRSSRARTEKELDYQRRRRRARQAKQKRAATLLARGISKTAAAAAVGVSPRTLHNWNSTPSFSRELERQRRHVDQHAVPRPRRTRRQSQRTSVPKPELAPPEPEAAAASGPPPAQQPSATVEALAAIEARRLESYEDYLDSNQARRGQLTPAEIRALEHNPDQKQPNR
jgi:ribosomal protein L12E/L44/L45/RPP1/RPP2